MEWMKWLLLIAANILALTLVFRYRSIVKKFFDRCYKIMIWVELVAAFIFGLFLVYETRSVLQKFFSNYKDVFAGVGYSLIAVGLIFTWVQLRAAKKRARANTSYQIHKDGREIRNSIEDEIVKVIESPLSSSEFLPENKEEATKAIREMLMFFSSVYHQYDFGNIDESEWKLLKEQLLKFLDKERVEEYWKKNITDNPSWHKGLRILGDDFLNEKQRRKK